MINSIKLIEEFSNAPGASGFEDKVVEVGKKYLSENASIKEDSLRNLYAYRNNNTGNKPVVMLDAHSDEVGFMVQSIKPNGLLQIIALGSWSNNTIPAHKVKVLNADGKYITGIIANKPPHYMTAAEKTQAIDISNMSIDIGATSSKEVINDFKIRIAAPVVPDVTFEYNEEKGLLLGKAFDCRIGCACVVEVMNRLKDEKLDVDIVGTLSSQEEIGGRGAKVTARTVKPNIAIAFEGCPADDNFASPYMIQTALRKGPMLRHIDQSMVTNPRYMRFTLDLAEKLNIPVQEAVRTGGGTNGGPIHVAEQGIPVIVIGIPVRYIHTHYGFATLEDYNNSVKLGVEVIKHLNNNIIQTF